MPQENRKPVDQILDLLLDALQERQSERNETRAQPDHDVVPPQQVIIEAEASTEPITAEVDENINPETPGLIEPKHQNGDGEHSLNSAAAFKQVPLEDDEFYSDIDQLDDPLPSINMNRIFYRLCVAIALIIVLVNIPFNRYGTNLARAMPDEQALIVRDGLVFTGPGDEVYVLENNQKRWISSLTSFELNGFHWDQVHEVDQGFIDQFASGPDYHAVIRCGSQPHIYILEGNEKRWIKNPTEFERAGLEWDDVRYISCHDLKNKYPDGVPIPPDAGDPPQW
jgi:hypothetical protein